MKKLIKLNKLNDKGLTLVEVMVSVTIFAIMIIPIITQLNSLLRMNYTEKLSQTETDYATRIMEHFKELNDGTISVLTNEDGDIITDANGFGQTAEGYFVDTNEEGKYVYALNNVQIEKDLDASATVTAKDASASEKVRYQVQITLDSNTYSTTSGTYADGFEYVNPNDAKDYDLTNLDEKFAVLVKESAGNYDTRAADDLMDKIALKLKAEDPKKYNAWLGGADVMQGLSYSKNTYVKIRKENDNYYATVSITYTDNTYSQEVTYSLMNEKEYKGEETGGVPPKIYIFYNQYVQDNLIISGSDTITIDNSECAEKRKDALKCYVVRGQVEDGGSYTYYVRKTSDEGGYDEMVGSTPTANTCGSYVYQITDSDGSTKYQWPAYVTNTRNDALYGSEPIATAVDSDGVEKYIYNDVVVSEAPSAALYETKEGSGYYTYVCKRDGLDTIPNTGVAMTKGSIVYQKADRQYVWPDGTVTAQAPNSAYYNICTPSKETFNESALTNIIMANGSVTEIGSTKMIKIYSNVDNNCLISTLNPIASNKYSSFSYSASEFTPFASLIDYVHSLEDDQNEDASNRLYHITLELYQVTGSDAEVTEQKIIKAEDVDNEKIKKILTLESGKEG